MVFTEVVYKIRNERHALCRLTAEQPGLSVILNVTSWDPDTRVLAGLLTLLGPEQDVRAALATTHELFDWVKVLEERKEEAVVKVSAGFDRLVRSESPFTFTLDYFGETGIIQPVMVRDGMFHNRVTVPGKVDLANMLAAYEKGVKAGRWNDFKLVRIDQTDPRQQLAGAFTEGLTQKQLEVIKTALALGFYNTPRKVTLDDLSSIFGISKAAVHNRLQAAERKVISKFFS